MTKLVATDSDSSAVAVKKQPMLSTPPECSVPGLKSLMHSHDKRTLSCCCLKKSRGAGLRRDTEDDGR